MSQMRVPVRILAMAEAEILDLIPARVIADIKREDKHPLFKAFVIVHEGDAEPTVIGLGKTLQRWFTSAVRALTEKLKIGTPVYNRHDEEAEASGKRISVGEIVGKALRTIKGQLSTIAVAYFFPAFRDMPFDVASIEADIRVPNDKREFDVKEPDIDSIYGIAVSNSAIDTPAFPGATLLAAVQAFAEKPDKETKIMTQEEIRKAILEAKLKPSDIFDLSELSTDPAVKEHIDEKVDNRVGFKGRKLYETEEKLKALEAERDRLKQKTSELTKTSLMVTGREALASTLKERKLDGDAKFQKFIAKVFEKSFTPTEEAALKKDVDKFIDGQIDEYADLTGAKPQVGAKGGTNDDDKDKGGGVGADDKGTADGDLTDPKNNPMIPKLD